jgi:hypothetical protein
LHLLRSSHNRSDAGDAAHALLRNATYFCHPWHFCISCITTHPILRAPRRFYTTASRPLKRCTTIHSNLRAPRRFYTASSKSLKRCGAGWQPAADWQSACLQRLQCRRNGSVVCGLPLCGAGWQNLRPIVKIGLPRPTRNLPGRWLWVCGKPLCGAGNLACSRLSRRPFGPWEVLTPVKSRLKAGGSQEWLPHNLRRIPVLGRVCGTCAPAKHERSRRIGRHNGERCAYQERLE